MTAAEVRSLNSYLTNCLVPSMKFHLKEADMLFNSGITTAKAFELENVKRMYRYHMAKAETYASAIADFKELFAEDLATLEE